MTNLMGCCLSKLKLVSYLMRLFSRGGLIGPVAIILTIQFVVLLGSLVVSNDLLDPILKGSNLSRASANSAHIASDGIVSDSSEQSYSPKVKSLFPISEVINEENEADSLYNRSIGSNLGLEHDVEYVVSRGDTISSIWSKNGAPTIGATKAIVAVRNAGLERFTIKHGERISLRVDDSGDISRLSKRLSDGSTLVISGSSSDGYDASLIKPNIIEEERSVVGSISSSFAASATDQGVSYSIIDDVVDLFSNRIEFSRAIQPGDSFTVTFTEKRCKETGQVLDRGPILSASFKRGDKLYAAIRHQDSSGSFIYYDENGQQGGDFFLRYPLKFTRISSTFSWARFHPVLQVSRPHHGVDFSAPVGTPIRTVGDGTIEILGFKNSTGNMIRIKHSDRWTTVYMHMQGFAPGLRSGQRVSRGQLIGYVGATGLCTGPHLHFELWENGQYIDPMAADLPSISNDNPGLPKGFLTAALKDLQQKHQSVQLAFISNGRHQG